MKKLWIDIISVCLLVFEFLAENHFVSVFLFRLLRIPSAGHACYLNNPGAFQSACLSFFEMM